MEFAGAISILEGVTSIISFIKTIGEWNIFRSRRRNYDAMPLKYGVDECVRKVRILWIDDMFESRDSEMRFFVERFIREHNYMVELKGEAKLDEVKRGEYHIVLCDYQDVGERDLDGSRTTAKSFLGKFRREYFDKVLYFVSGERTFDNANAANSFESWNKRALTDGGILESKLRDAISDYMTPQKYWRRASENMSTHLNLDDGWIQQVKAAFVSDYYDACKKLRSDGTTGDAAALMRLKKKQTDAIRIKCISSIMEYVRL